MSKKIAVSASVIRTAFREDGLTVRDEGLASVLPGARGRLSPVAVEDFLAQVKNRTYREKSDAEVKMVTVKVPAKDKAGRNITKKVNVPQSKARALAGEAGKRGPLSKAGLAKIAESYKG